MSIPDYRESSSPVQDAPLGAVDSMERTVLPSMPRSTTPTADRKRSSRGLLSEVLLGALVVALAFLAASFVARNGDVWLHLATGRLVAQGGYSFGVDPFAYTTAGVYWANHAWLYDLGMYLLYAMADGPGLVAFKAVLIAVLAGIMLRLRGSEKSAWLPAFCTALAMLVLTPRLLLQPICVSFTLLGLTLYILWRFRAAPWRPRLLGRDVDARAVLIPLCALWVNLDEWFLLGPTLVALFWVGDRMQPAGARRPGERPTPVWLFPACLLACFCSPHHYHAFVLPADLVPALSYGGLLEDIRFQRLSTSVWQLNSYLYPSSGFNTAAAAYVVLAALGVLSFALNRSGLRDWRILVWGAFFLLGAWQVRLIPFFAIVAAPIAVLNLHELKYEPRSEVVLALRSACLLFLVALVALAVPGWLHGLNQKGRQVAWDVEIEPSLRRAAERLKIWRDRGQFRQNQHSFGFHPDVACYCAWFGGEKSFLDTRFSLFGRKADDYAAVCRDLDPTLAVPGTVEDQGRVDEWGEDSRILSDNHVLVVVLYDPDPVRLLSLTSRLNQRDGWGLLAVDGQAVIFLNRPQVVTRGLNPWNSFESEPVRWAYGDSTGVPTSLAPYPAPGIGPGRDPIEPGIGASFGKPPRPTWESPAASVYMRLFDEGEGGRRPESVDQYYTLAASGFAGFPGMPAAAGAPTGPMEYATSLLFRLTALDEVLSDIDDRPPELPLLAVRAARRAVAANPDDANAYLRLGQAYLALRDATMERSRGGALSPLALLRHIQIATALRQALILNPDLESAHHHLAMLFLKRRYFDAAWEHRRDEAILSRRAGPRPGEDAALYKQRVDALDRDVQDLEKSVQNAQDQFAIHSQPLAGDPLAKAQMAVSHGLGKQALEGVLLQSRVELFGSAGARLELELLLMLGRGREVQGMLADADMKANKNKLTTFLIPLPHSADSNAAYAFPAYEWLLACQQAALGDYDAAEDALKDICDALEADEKKDRMAFKASLRVMLPLELAALAQSRPVPLALLLSGNRELEVRQVFLQAERADVLVLRAMLALERGTPADGERLLEESIALSGSTREAGVGCPGRPLAQAYLERIRAGR